MSNIDRNDCFGVLNLYCKHLGERLQPWVTPAPFNHIFVIVGALAHILALLALLALLAHSLALRMDRIRAIR